MSHMYSVIFTHEGCSREAKMISETEQNWSIEYVLHKTCNEYSYVLTLEG